jgi:transketolase
VPEGVRERFREKVGARGEQLHAAWRAAFARYREAFPEPAHELERIFAGELPEGWDQTLPTFPADAQGMASRAASGKALNALAQRVPWMIGGSADLEPSNKTWLGFQGSGVQGANDPGGRNVHFGVREHAMASIANGLALSGLRPFVGTFLIFSDYMRPAQRLAALMGLPVVYVLTHDSIGVGEDGPTHQPIEQIAALRALPNLAVVRPCDANETVEAWRFALASRSEPVALALTRQNLPVLDRTRLASASGLARGAYVLSDPEGGGAQVILIGTGSEVSLCLDAQRRLAQEGIPARVVSMPCWELFARQTDAYRESVLPRSIGARVAVEAAAGMGWERWVGERGEVVCLRGFGASAPAGELFEHFGLTVDAVVEAARKQLSLATA